MPLELWGKWILKHLLIQRAPFLTARGLPHISRQGTESKDCLYIKDCDIQALPLLSTKVLREKKYILLYLEVGSKWS